MNDSQTTVAELRSEMQAFVDARDWRQFHNPKNLSMSLAIEAAELMEHFQWLDHPAAAQRANDPEYRTAIADELADVACYLLSLANSMEIDLSTSIRNKLVKNAIKYPAIEYRGRAERRRE